MPDEQDSMTKRNVRCHRTAAWSLRVDPSVLVGILSQRVWQFSVDQPGCWYSGRCDRLLACLLARDLPAGLTYFPGSVGGGPEVSSLCGNLVVERFPVRVGWGSEGRAGCASR